MSDTFVKEYTPLSDEQKAHVASVKDKAQALLDECNSATYANPRMMAIANTNLEQAVMWAVKGITNP